MDETQKTPETSEAAENVVDLEAAADELLQSAGDDGVQEGEESAEGEAELSMEDRLVMLQHEKSAINDQLLRALAENQNIRKRAERQVADERVYAIEKFARDILPVSDNLARALSALDDASRAALSEHGQNLLSGVEMTQKELHAAMARHGVTAIDAAPGASFDPNDHQAVSQIPSEQPAGMVAEMFQSGWKIGNRTLRAAMVAVSAGKAN